MAHRNVLTPAQAEDVRDRFFKMTRIDLYTLEPGEIDLLLSLLPLALVYIHECYTINVADEQDDA